MAVQCQEIQAFPPNEYVGVAIGVPNVEHPQQRHVGIIYSLDGQTPRLCHLQWHYRLADEPLPSCYLWGRSGLDPINKKIVAAYVSKLGQNFNSIPYGIGYSGHYFDDKGKFIPQENGRGLTCATFILAAFEALGIYLLNADSWPAREDDASWQSLVISVLEKTGAEKAHIELMKNDIGAKRFRPEEVAAGFISENMPVDFDNASAMAKQILVDIYGTSE